MDIWSAGVVMFSLLLNYSPFDYETVRESYAKIRKRKFIYVKKDWEKIPSVAIDLVKPLSFS